MDVGIGLWTMRSTAASPAAHPRLYGELAQDARLAESLGFHSLWLAEHHFWYDGWCPNPLAAAAAALAATSTLHVGTGIHLLPLYDTDRVARDLGWLSRLSGGRLEHGIGLGYRSTEYDGFGRSRRVRGRRMDAALDRIAELGADAPRTWVGGFAEAALERAGSRGLGVLLPSTLTSRQLEAAIAQVRAKAEETGRPLRIGVMKYAWPTDGTPAGRDMAVARLGAWTREYSGSWFWLKGRPGFEAPELLDAQMQRSADTALIGSPQELVAELSALSGAGAEFCMLHLIGDTRAPEHRDMMAMIAAEVLPQVRDLSP